MPKLHAPNDEIIDRLELLVSEAVSEIRTCLSGKAKEFSLHTALMSMATLIDRIDVCVDYLDSDGSFELSEDSHEVVFSATVLHKVISEIVCMADEIEVDENHLVKISVNMFLIHELLHIRQNFPHYGTVQIIKNGLGDIGLPMLDVAADTIAAHLCALIESERADDLSEECRLSWYVTCLIISYVIGNFVFTSDGNGKVAKKQRAIGLLTSALLVQAKLNNQLDETKISSAWEVDTPLFALDGEKCGAFDAIVIDKLPTLLINAGISVPPEDVKAIWKLIGKRPVYSILEKIGDMLQRYEVIMRPIASPPNNAL